MTHLPVLVVVGPTASGKTELGLSIANQFPAEIISADSIQVYQYFDIGSAKPSLAERQLVKHHLIDFLHPHDEYNAGIFINLAREKIKQIHSLEKLPIILGGTGLYIKALLYGIIDIPRIIPEVKTKVDKILQKRGVSVAHQELTKIDPKTAQRLKKNDRLRIQRALEVFLQTGRSITEIQREHEFKQINFNPMFVSSAYNREEIYRRINQRTIKMVEAGLIEETSDILNINIAPTCKPMQSIGYKQCLQYLRKEIDLKTMIQEIQKFSRRYAKRQLTWQNQNPETLRIELNNKDKLFNKINDFFQL